MILPSFSCVVTAGVRTIEYNAAGPLSNVPSAVRGACESSHDATVVEEVFSDPEAGSYLKRRERLPRIRQRLKSLRSDTQDP